MKYYKPGIHIILWVVVMIFTSSCYKVDLTIQTPASSTDPNITYFDNYRTDISTYKTDSFPTSGHKLFTLGYHIDPVFGVVKASSYAQINLPSYNPIATLNQPLIYDSLELIIKPAGRYYGDSTIPMKINVFRLTQNMQVATAGNSFYNTSTFSYNPTALGQTTVRFNGISDTAIHIRLSNALGQELFTKFQNNDNDVSSQANFINYFKGIYLNTDTLVTRSISYFLASNDTTFLRLSYHQTGLFASPAAFNFNADVINQSNNISFNLNNPQFSAFITNQKQQIPSSLSGGQSFLNSHLGSYIKIAFPTLLNLKELYPYIKIVKAVLVIKPDVKSLPFPYRLPPQLYLFTTDTTNVLQAPILDGTLSNSAPQTGNLLIDNLYNVNTYYSYDITNFINFKISEGQISTSALMLLTPPGYSDAYLDRLIINDQSKTNGIQLKLYVLGL